MKLQPAKTGKQGKRQRADFCPVCLYRDTRRVQSAESPSGIACECFGCGHRWVYRGPWKKQPSMKELVRGMTARPAV